MRTAAILSSIIFGFFLNSAIWIHHKEEQKQASPYIYNYVGEEKWNNVFAGYRLNVETGELLRFSYTIFEEAADGTPSYDQIEVLDMLSGESRTSVSSKDRMFLKWHYEKVLDEAADSDKNSNDSIDSTPEAAPQP